MADVKLQFLANGESADKVIAQLEKRIDTLTAKVGSMGKKGKDSAGSWMSEFGKLGTMLTGLAGSYIGVGAAVGTITAANRAWAATAEAAARAQDKANRGFRVQAGVFGLQGKEATAKIEAAKGIAGMSSAEAQAFAGAFIEKGGMSANEVTSNLPALMKGFAATKAAKGGKLEAEDFADALGDILSKSGRDFSAKNIEAGTREIFGLTRGTEVEVGQLDTMQETLMNASAGKGAKRKKKALKELGLKFGDVDLQGETLEEALGRIQSGLQNVKAERRSPLLQELTGDADMAKNMLAAMGGMQANNAMFDQAAKEATTGRAMGRARMEGARERAAGEGAADYEDLLLAGENVRRARGQSETRISIAGMIGEWMGAFSPSSKDRMREGMESAAPGSLLADIKDYLAAARESEEAQTEVLRRIERRSQGLPSRKPDNNE